MVVAHVAGGFGICLFLTTLVAGPPLAVALLVWAALATDHGFQNLFEDMPPPWFATLAAWLLFLLALVLLV